MAKQGFKQIGNFLLAQNSSTGSPLTSGQINKVHSGTEYRYIHNNGINSFYAGIEAGPSTITDSTSGVNNCGVGYRALASIDTTGASNCQNNTAIGGTCMNALTTGSNNAVMNGFGYLTTGSNNSGCGHEVGMTASTGGVTTGSDNCFLGYRAGGNYTSSESSNIIIGSNNGSTVGESNTLRIASGTGTSSGQLNAAYIHGIYGKAYGGTNAAVYIDNTGKLGTTPSSIRYKQNVNDIGTRSEIIYQLRPRTFEYKDKLGIEAWGLIAEEVSQVFKEIVNFNDKGTEESVRYNDLVPLLLNEIQKLRKEVDELKAK